METARESNVLGEEVHNRSEGKVEWVGVFIMSPSLSPNWALQSLVLLEVSLL